MNETEVKDGCREIYHVGMKDAWDIVRKIFDMNDYQRYAIFGSENSRYIMMNLQSFIITQRFVSCLLLRRIKSMRVLLTVMGITIPQTIVN